MIKSQEDVINLSLKIFENIQNELIKSEIVLTTDESDTIYTSIVAFIDRKAQYPEYEHMM